MAVVGTATIEIHAALDAIQAEVSSGIRQALATVNTDIEIHVDTTAANAEIDALIRKLGAVGAMDPTIRVSVDTSGADTAMTRVREQADLLGRADPNIRVGANTAGADAQLEVTRLIAERLGAMSPTIRPDVDSGPALAGMGRIAAEVSGLGISTSLLGNGMVDKFALIGTAAGAAGAAIGGAFAAISPIMGIAIGAIGTVALGLDGIKQAAQSIAPQFTALKDEVSSVFEQSLTPVFERIGNVLLPGITSNLDDIAGSLSMVASQVVGVLTSAQGMSAINTILGGTTTFLQTLAPGLAMVTQSFLQMASAGMPALQGLATVANQAFGQFNAMISGLISSGTFQQAITGFVGTLGSLSSILNNLIGGLIQMAAQLLGPVNQGLDAINGLIAPLLSLLTSLTAAIVPVITALANALAPALQALVPLFDTFMQALGQSLVAVMQAVAPILLQVAQSIGMILNAIVPLLGPFSTTIQLFQLIANVIVALEPILVALVGAIVQVVNAISGALTPLMPVITRLIDNLAQAIVPVIGQIGQLAVIIVNALAPVLPPLVNAIDRVVQALAPVLPVIGQFVVALVQGLAPILPIIINLITGLLYALTPLIPPIIQIVQSLLPPFEAIIKALQPVLGALATAFESVVRALIPIIPPLAQVVQALIPPLLAIISALQPVLLQIVQAFVDLVRALTPLLPPLTQIIISLLPVLVNIINVLTPVISFLARIISDVLVFAIRILSDVLTFIIRIITDVVTAIAAAIKWVTDWGNVTSFFSTLWNTVWGAVKDFFIGIWNDIKNFATTVWNAISSFFTSAFNAFTNFFSTIWNGISNFFSSIWNGIKNVATTVWNAIVSFLQAGITGFSNFFSAIWNGISSFFTGIWNGIKAAATAIWNAISGFFTAAFNTFTGFFQGVWNGISNFFSNIWNGIRNAASSVWNGISGFFTTAFNNFIGFFQGIWNRVSQIFSDVWNGIKQTAHDIWQGILDAISGAINGVINFINGMIHGVNKVLGWVHLGPIGDIPQVHLETGGVLKINAVPMLAAGGDLFSQWERVGAGFKTGGPRAIVGEGNQAYPEYVIPTDPKYRNNAAKLMQSAAHDMNMLEGGGTIRLLEGGGGLGWATDLLGITGGAAVVQGVSDLASLAAKGADAVIEGLANAAKALMPDNLIGQYGTGLINNIERPIIDWINSVAKALQQAAAVASGNAPGAPTSVSGNAAIVQQQAASYGWSSGAEWNALYNVIMRESGFRNTAQNPTSTAYGMFQFLDGTWGAYGIPKTSDPTQQAIAGLRYIKGRYNDPLGAMAHENNFGWYDNGGWLPPGLTMAHNQTGQHELIMPVNLLRDAIREGFEYNRQGERKYDRDDEWARRIVSMFNTTRNDPTSFFLPNYFKSTDPRVTGGLVDRTIGQQSGPAPRPPVIPQQPTTSIPVHVTTPEGNIGDAFKAALRQFAPDLQQAVAAGSATQVVALGQELLNNPQRMAALNQAVADTMGVANENVAGMLHDMVSSAMPTAKKEEGTPDPTFGAAGTMKSAQSKVSSSSSSTHTGAVTFHPGAFQVNVHGNADQVTVAQLQATLGDWADELLHQVRGRK